MEYRRPNPEDFQQIVELQNRNLRLNLSADDLTDGFLGTAFTIDQFKEMDRSIAVVVAIENDKICGYLCASTPEFNESTPAPSAMLKACSRITYKGKVLTDYKFFVATPICIDKKYRGTGVYIGLCQKILELIPHEHELAVGFIHTENHRHLKAREKMDLEIVGQFSLGENTFHIIVRPM